MSTPPPLNTTSACSSDNRINAPKLSGTIAAKDCQLKLSNGNGQSVKTIPIAIADIKIEIGPTTILPMSPPLLMDENPVYNQRKCMMSEYKELFSALLRLPDKQIQKKVLSCINAKYRSIATQTNPVEVIDIIPPIVKEEITQSNEEESNVNREEQFTSTADTCSESTVSKPASPKKRKRKRKISLPQANKVSRVAVAKKQQLVKLSKPPHQQQMVAKLNNDDTRNYFETKRCRRDSCDFSDSSSYINGIFDDIQKEETRSREQLFQIFIKDCLLAEITLENGLLPIQDSVIKSQQISLNRQIFIWKDWKKADLNEILTDEGEDLLQLAITHNCLPNTAKLLLEKGLNPCCLDDQGNTVLHLAVMHDVDKHLLQQLMECIDLNMLLAFNDEGYTSLHLAVRKDCYLLAECLLNAIDERLSGKIFYGRSDDILETNENIRKVKFQDYYEKVCLQMEIDGDHAPSVINNHDQKQKLLDAIDMRSGNTALFFAIENQLEHLVYFLLAHLTDPCIENFSGQDCKSFFSEFCKTLHLSLNIDNAMEKVIKLLS